MSKPTLKIAKVRDMTPTKLSISVAPDLKADLDTYTRLYEDAYGDQQETTALIPLMLEAFLATDSGFKKAKRELESAG